MSIDSPTDQEPPGFQPRRTERTAVGDEAARLTADQRYTVEIKVQNVSSAGFMAVCAEPVMIGSYVSLDVPGVGAVRAQVRWQIGTRMGGMFTDPISLTRCEWTAERAKAA